MARPRSAAISTASRALRLMTPVALAAALAAVAGCGASRDYAVPDHLCGLLVRSADLAPLLPDGDDLTQDRYALRPGAPRCRVSVDDAEVMRLAGDVIEPSTDPFEVKESGLLSQGHPARARNIGKRATLTDHGALAVTDCTYRGERKQYAVELDLATDTPEKTADRRDAVLTFFRSHVARAAHQQGCT